jgi:ankyrin repeat protein
MVAAWRGDSLQVEELIHKGADVNAKLVQNIDLRNIGSGGIGPVWMPTAKARTGDFFRSCATLPGGTALMIAAAEGHSEIVRRLLEAGADPTAKTDNGKHSALNFAKYLKSQVDEELWREESVSLSARYRDIVVALETAIKQWTAPQ